MSETTPKPPFDAEKFARDLRSSLEEAEVVAKDIPDGGTCNFDATVIFDIPWTKKTREIFAGRGNRIRWLGAMGVMIRPPVSGQANRRCAGAQALTEALRARGWNASTYYQMD